MVRIQDGEVTMSAEEYDKLLHSHYVTYKLRRAANEMFRQHIEIRGYGSNVPAATGAQMAEWQAVLNKEDDADD